MFGRRKRIEAELSDFLGDLNRPLKIKVESVDESVFSMAREKWVYHLTTKLSQVESATNIIILSIEDSLIEVFDVGIT